MTTFDEREKAFEKKYAHEQDMLFHAIVRRNRAIGMWAADQLGKRGADAEAYAKSIVAAGVDKPGDNVIIDRIAEDFRAAAVGVPREEIGAELSRLMAVALAAQKNA